MSAFNNTEMLSRVPLIVILGATGTGKTKLSLNLAKKYGGEILNADSMQVYRGLDILTNKATEDERQQAPHHLLGFLEPSHQYSATQFQADALRTIEGIHSRGKIPIVVGGTHYYIESILWDFLIPSAETKDELRIDTKKFESCENEVGQSILEKGPSAAGVGSEGGTKQPSLTKALGAATEEDGSEEPANKRLKSCQAVESDFAGGAFPTNLLDSGLMEIEHDALETALEKLPTHALYQLLASVDPATAEIVHPSNRRKIIRAIQVFCQTKRTMSEILQEQRESAGSVIGGRLRYPNAVVFWISCDEEVLKPRLDARVDEMLEQGLLKEVDTFYETWKSKIAAGEDVYERGIFQSIGFKEFHEYLTLSAEDRTSKKGEKMLKESIEMVKIHTKAYAKRQLRWIRRRFLTSAREAPPLWCLDATDPSPARWEQEVHLPAVAVIDACLGGNQPDPDVITPMPIAEGPGAEQRTEDMKKIYFCDVCERSCVGKIQFSQHLESKKHQKMVARKKRLQKQSEEEGSAPSSA